MISNLNKKRIPCSEHGCKSFHYGRGICIRHYKNSVRYKEEHQAKLNSVEYKNKSKEYSERYRNKPDVKKRRSDWQKLLINRYRILCTRAKRKGLEVELTREQHDDLISKVCLFCGSFSEGVPYVGVDRLDNSLGYTTENSVPCCASCNYMKAETPVKNWLENILKIADFQRKT